MDGLGDAVKNQELVSDEKIKGRCSEFVVNGTRHHRLHVMDKLISDEPDRTPRESGKSGNRDRAVAAQHFFNDLQSVANTRIAIRSWLAGNGKFLDDFSALDNLNPRAGLFNDGPGIASNK